jgi:predicted Zn-dependent protease
MSYSRKHELEADRLGVDLMAQAGYRPAEALTLWRNMAANRTGGQPPQILSTHPSDSTRIAELEAYMRSKGMI